MKRIVPLIFSMLMPLSILLAQGPKVYTSADIVGELKKLNTLGSVMYIAAHPDDENTNLIAYLVNKKHLRTAYFAFTRGDGGQNLIGPEIREGLGVIRTQELLKAREVDGGEQMFSRANDFGYSKNPDETFSKWGREEALGDLVWAIRKFRPDVLITRFPENSGGRTHGHHTASAILAREAFNAAGDASRFPEQLKFVKPWQPQGLYWNSWTWAYRVYYNQEDFDTSKLITYDVGAYDALKGQSMTEIAAKGRSMHKSQGFGTVGKRGSNLEYLDPLEVKGEIPKSDVFENIDTDWSRVKGGKEVGKWINKAIEEFNPNDPSTIIPDLVQAYRASEKLKSEFWKLEKQEELKKLIKACAGLYLQATSDEYSKVPGEDVNLTLEAINRSKANILLDKVTFSLPSDPVVIDSVLYFNQEKEIKKVVVKLPEYLPYSDPYWLKKEGTQGMFRVDDQKLIGLPENLPVLTATFHLKVDNVPIDYRLPVVYKKGDPVEGEVYRPFSIVPSVFVNLPQKVLVYSDEQARSVEVKVQAGKANVKGELQLELPQGWKAEPATIAFDLRQKGEEQSLEFLLTPPQTESSGFLRAVAVVDDKRYDQEIQEIDYSHIPSQLLMPKAKAKLVKLNLVRKGEKVAYVPGAGDDIPAALGQIGFQVDELHAEDISSSDLEAYDAIILGVRAYNTQPALKFAQEKLLNYVKNGGTMIVQYNTNFRLVLDEKELAPYPLNLSRDRVTVEESKITFLQPENKLLNYPNKITEKDFEGWVQERGLYFPNQWDAHFDAVISSQDPGESAKDGGLLIAQYGKGYYIYTGYSWFRELPAGVPGAYRIFTNMISVGM
ncbi:PIG-L family deacetylase [Xanthovirga aplysinae]|uniref:PIG-L family deacetylase n=1 Tax=Xanthovirga aplysinae TaxID=2529853 RepID=UPI0012BC6DDF|nr:PIG-L family deacetylase [Xanthovirga aplysinae]MTI29982.1 LmbE family protein [Xanthovirga aplysinae]